MDFRKRGGWYDHRTNRVKDDFEIIFELLHETLSIPVLSKNAPRMIAFIVVTKLARLIVSTFEEFGTFDRNDKVSRDGNTEYSRRDAPEEDRSQDAASSKGLDQR